MKPLFKKGDRALSGAISTQHDAINSRQVNMLHWSDQYTA